MKYLFLILALLLLTGVVSADSINQTIDELRQLPYERAVAFDESKQAIYEANGTTNSVRVSMDDIRGRVVIHNHPDSIYILPGFSREDIDVATRAGVRQMILVEHDRILYSDFPFTDITVDRGVASLSGNMIWDWLMTPGI